MASSSSPSCKLSLRKYDVFLSFRGEDSRKTFVDHLYSALHQKGIVTFQDGDNLERGKSIRPELLKAIGESSIAIIIFSRNYASSSWCLDELVEIIKQHKETNQIVYPVFYGVDPSEVRKQEGSFGEGFARHEGGKLEVWRDALVEAANLSGWDTKGHEAECVKAIIKDIQGHLYHKYSILEENLIGIIPRVEKVKSFLRMELGEVRMIGIWGMGGAGKTTIARCVFNELANQFDSTRFVGNVREIAEKSGLLSVQKELLLSMDRNLEIHSVHQGTQMIRKLFSREKVLIVLDDVDELSQLDALAGGHNWFGEGSRVIITTRNERLLLAHGINEDIYNVDLLNIDEALRLFSLYAFRMNSPINDYEQHSRLVVQYAAGHPLTLKILSNALRGRDMKKWITTTDRLKEIPKTETLETLKVSFDALEDVEKEIFLDIACFFKGWHSIEVYKILDCCGFDTEKWVSDLIQRALISISSERLDMHDMIQEMGHHIVRGKSFFKDPQKHSRLWGPQEVLDVLVGNKGTEEIQAIVVEGLYSAESLNLTHAFKNMTNLRLLHLDTKGMDFIGPEYLPSSLKYLNWKNYTSNSLPANFGSGNLVGLNMHSSSVLELWKGVKHLQNLKFIDCQESKKLTKTPNFTGVPNLERLDFSGCSSLVKVHESIGCLENLEILDFSNCYELKSFPSYITMKSLKTLSLRHCHNFKKFPEIQEKMDRLSHIYLHHTSIEQLPESIVNLPNLSVLSLLGCINLKSLPNAICMLQSLTYLDVRRCIKLATLPKDFGNIVCLQHLLVSTVTELPSSIINLKNLETFSAVEPPSSSSSISQKRGVLGWLFEQKKSKSKSQTDLPRYSLYEVLPSLSSLTSLKELGLCNLQEGMTLPVDIGTLSSLEYLILCDNQFTKLPFSISQLSVLKRVDVSNCPRLEELPDLPPTVAILFANNCKSLRAINGISSAHGHLRQVSLLGCRRLEDQLTANVLQTALQGYNQTTVLLPGFEIPKWFQSESTGIGQTVIELPKNWNDVITGISLCVVADLMGLSRPISLTLSTKQIPSKNRNGMYHSDRLHLWMEYISFDLLQRSCEGILGNEWITTTPGLVLTVSTENSGVKICGVRFVYKDVNFEEIRIVKKQENLLRCFRETEFDGVSYSLQPGVKYVPEGDAAFDKLSWNEKHEYYRSGRSSIKVGMNILD